MAKKQSILIPILILVFTLLPSAISTQPPVVTDTLYVGYPSWGPRIADPMGMYDTYGAELIFNAYDTLIMMGQPVSNAFGTWDTHEQYWAFSPSLATNVPAREDITKSVSKASVPPDPTGFVFSDGSTCVGWNDDHKTGSLDYGDVLYLVETDGSYRTWYVDPAFQDSENFVLWRGRYVFTMRTDPGISFINETGQTVDAFDVYDAEYTFKRGLVLDEFGGPVWMYYDLLFDKMSTIQMNSDFFNSNTSQPTAMTLAHLIDNAIEISGNNLTINVGIPFPDTAFKQILSLDSSAIMSKEFSISIGCWNSDLFADSNGDGFPDWWANRSVRSPYDTGKRWVGTGPYRVSFYNYPASLTVRLTRNPNYWRGWPATQRKGYLETVELRYVSDWTQRKSDFIAGNLDVISVPTANMGELLDSYGEPSSLDIKTIKNLPSLEVDTVVFTFNINLDGYWGNSFIGSGHLPDGIPADFFNNTHVRKAFAYSINRTKYVKDMFSGEAIVPSTPLIKGLYPDYRSGIAGYDISFDLAETELKNAVFNGQNVWETGFTFVIPYWYATPSLRWAEMIRDFFAQLSTYDGRPAGWPDFSISLEPIYPYLGEFYPDPNEIPIAKWGWLVDYADADSFIRPFMSSTGYSASFQNYTAANGWGIQKDDLVSSAVKTPDGPARAAIYAELQQKYIDDVPSFPLSQPMDRRWQKYWVKGWYYNPLYPSQYYYGMYKDQACWGDATGPSVGVPDGVCGMRDVGYVAGHFGARAPENARVPPYDSKWAPGVYSAAGADVYGDRKVDMRDIGFECAHFGGTTEP
jgi:peptide/nickel transport system substrate-binding protein